jgi:hypothetical protein
LFSSTLASDALGVQHLAAQRGSLAGAVAALLRRAAGRIALDDEELAALARGIGQSLNLPGRFRRVEVALLRETSARAARLASRARREDDAP